MSRPRRSTILVLLVGAALVLAAFLALRGAWDAPAGPPPRIWTLDPLPTLADLTGVTSGPPPAADIRHAPDGRTVRGWDAIWSARWGRKGGPDVVWEIRAIPTVSVLDRVCAPFTDDAALEALVDFESTPVYLDAGVTELRDGATWRAWDLRAGD